ncbi:hypothetical protein RSAG8_05834, partial [Rhizoctonia solani AG-8 WAC10335]
MLVMRYDNTAVIQNPVLSCLVMVPLSNVGVM